MLTDGTVMSGTWINGQRVRDAEGKLLPDTLELGLLAQGRLLEDALATVPASTSAVELYTLTLGGDGKQSVFLRESDYVANMLRAASAPLARSVWSTTATTSATGRWPPAKTCAAPRRPSPNAAARKI